MPRDSDGLDEDEAVTVERSGQVCDRQDFMVNQMCSIREREE